PSGTTTTITGGANQNSIKLSNSAETGGLDNLPGPVVVNGGASGTDIVTLDDSSVNFNDNYTVTSTTVARNVFGGLTYGNIGTLTLNAENTLGANGNNTISINSTANGVTTNVNGQGGVDTVNINNTGTTGTLNVNLGTSDGGTVNAISTNEPVNITLHALSTVNIGSTGGAGTMANIQGAISVSNPPSFTALNLHDENDVTARTWTMNDNDGGNTGSIAIGPGIATTNYVPADISSLTINGGSGGNTFVVNNTTAFAPTTLNAGTGADSVNVLGTGNNTLNIHGQAGQDTVTLGGNSAPPLGMQGLNGTINVDNTLGFTSLVLDDALDTAGRTALLFNDGTNGQITGLAPATVNYTNTALSGLTVHGGGGGNTFTVNGTLANAFVPSTLTTLNKGSGASNTVNILATNANSVLDLTGTGTPDTVNIGNNGSMAGILGQVAINEAPGSTNLTFDFSSDALPHVLDLSSDGTTSTLHDELGNLPGDITYTTASLRSLTIDANGSQSETLNIDFGGGLGPPNGGEAQNQPFNAGTDTNPIPTGSPGLIFNAGNGPGSHALNLLGELPTGPLASETHNANDGSVSPQVGQYGSLIFDDGTGSPTSLTRLNYTGLQPINDTVPALNYTFNDFADDQSFTLQNGPVVLGLNTVQFVNTPAVPPPTFETTNIANKAFVVFNTTTTTNGLNGIVNITTPSTGLLSLTVNTPASQDHAVSFLNTPPGVVTSLVGGSDEDITNVTGVGVAAGTVLFANGGASVNALNYDAGGLIPTITAGLLPGEVLISIPGAGIVDAVGYSSINVTNVTPIVLTPGPATSINSAEGFQLVNQVVATFTAPILITQAPAGMPASDFTASIDWGDPSVDPAAGTITQNASNPSLYYITGTHAFAAQGTFTVANTVAFAGATYSTGVNGTPISITLPSSGPTAGTSATAAVTQGTLAVSAFPIVGTEGLPVAAGPIASFIDAGGASPVANYSATISIINSAGTTILAVAAASITQNGSAAEYTVNAPALTLPEQGTYRIVVAVTDGSGATPVTVSGTSTATVADAALTAGAAVNLTPNTGAALTAATVGTFTDADPAAPTSDFTAVIDWGDGSSSAGTLSQPGGVGTAFSVTGSHAYAKPGSYSTKTIVTDVGGSNVTLNGTATVTDLAVTGAVRNFSAVEGQNTGTIVLATFTSPNPLATAADFTATLPAGGWGDGTPGASATLSVVPIGGTATSTIFQVTGNHTYAGEGAFTVNVSVTTSGGVTTVLTSGTATIADAPLSGGSGNPITATEGAPAATFTVATFSDANPGASIGEFTGTVTATSSTGQVVNGTAVTFTAQGNGVFTVTASLAFPEEGTWSIATVVNDAGGSKTQIGTTATVADAALTATATSNVAIAEGTPTGSVRVGTFTDANPNPVAGEYAAIIDWGDGSPTSFGTFSITPGIGGAPAAVAVNGTHVYKEDGTFTITAAVTDVGGQRVTTTATANVTDPAATGVAAIPANATQGQNTGQIAVAIFTDPNPYSTTSDWNTTIDWGDGSATDVGNVVLVGGAVGGGHIFKVFGSHSYAQLTASASPALTAVVVTLNDADTPANDVVVTGPAANVTREPHQATIDLVDTFDSGLSNKDNITNIVPEQYRVSAEAGTNVVILDGEKVIDSFVMPVTADGFTTRTLTLAEGAHPLSAQATNAAGVHGEQSETLLVTVDLTAPAAPSAPQMVPSSDSNLPNDNITSVTTPAFQGTAEANSIVRILATDASGVSHQIGQTVTGSDATDGVTGNGLGRYEVTVAPLAYGFYTIKASAEDVAGNISPLSSSGTQIHISNFQLQMATPISYPSLTQPMAVVTGDLTGDGRIDMVSVDQSGNISTFINRGSTTFQRARRTNVGGLGPVDLALGDVNGDGKLDVVTANSLSGNVSVLFGNGDGTFAHPRLYKVFNDPTAIRLGDVNGDGKLDIIVTNTATHKMSYLLNKGNGTFGAVKSFRIPGVSPIAFDMADLNGDGKLDLVAVNNTRSLSLDVMLGNGNGTFQTSKSYRVGLPATSVRIADVDNDGILDIVASNATSKFVSVLLGKGGGLFNTRSRINYVGANLEAQAIGMADLNSDGYQDIIMANAKGDTLGIMLGNGNGTFQPMTQLPMGKVVSGQADAIATADFNNDGLTDVVVANAGSDEVNVFFNSQPGHGDNSGLGSGGAGSLGGNGNGGGNP
ncbi:MAG: FG-GAP-like repeat-containing protein, partial [Tepidisphaeraceae bacterium]